MTWYIKLYYFEVNSAKLNVRTGELTVNITFNDSMSMSSSLTIDVLDAGGAAIDSQTFTVPPHSAKTSYNFTMTVGEVDKADSVKVTYRGLSQTKAITKYAEFSVSIDKKNTTVSINDETVEPDSTVYVSEFPVSIKASVKVINEAYTYAGGKAWAMLYDNASGRVISQKFYDFGKDDYAHTFEFDEDYTPSGEEVELIIYVGHGDNVSPDYADDEMGC
ncbi:MAG: hypothetical protein J7J61_00865 [Candidatus Hydrothermae bacterium]|nr:hypothetical protein [Candidatus Hydrothermae bacterium]